MTLGDKVKERRKQQGWDQATLARKSGVSQASISRTESGKTTQPRLFVLQALSQALGTSIDYLVADAPPIGETLTIEDFRIEPKGGVSRLFWRWFHYRHRWLQSMEEPPKVHKGHG